MTFRWLRTGGFTLGAGVEWGDRKHLSVVATLYLGPRCLLAICRWWL